MLHSTYINLTKEVTIKRLTLFLLSILLTFSTLSHPTISTSATSCPDYQIIYARGSGQSLNDEDYRSFKSTLEERLKSLNISYQFYQLGATSQNGHQYPAISVENFSTLLGAKISAGKAFKYGESVQSGKSELKSYITNLSASCPSTHFILAGYSQGAQVISTTLSSLPTNKITYVATLGDPKLYLPEGITNEDNITPACLGKDYSDYRANVPDCHVSEGILEANVPYRPNSLKNKVGTWCNYADFMCGSKFDFNNLMYGHTSYTSNGSYAEISKRIASTISSEYSAKDISLQNSSDNLVDVAILTDNTCVSPANSYEYNQFLDSISGNYPLNTQFYTHQYSDIYHQSTAAAVQTVYQNTNWREGSQKNILIVSKNPLLEDSDTLSISEDEIIKYAITNNISISVITTHEQAESYQNITSSTSGKITFATFSNNNGQISYSNHTTLSIDIAANILSSNANQLSLVIIDDAIIGFTDQTDLTITDLKDGDKVKIIPISSNGRRLDSINYSYSSSTGFGSVPINIKAPNSGQN